MSMLVDVVNIYPKVYHEIKFETIVSKNEIDFVSTFI